MLTLILDQSHRYSYTTTVRAAFRLLVKTQSEPIRVRNLHYIVLVDASGSMKGNKIAMEKIILRKFLECIPAENYLSLIVFGLRGSEVYEYLEHAEIGLVRSKAINAIKALTASYTSPLYKALLNALSLAKKYNEPGYIVVITDGRPSDERNPLAYYRLEWVKKMRLHIVGIGSNYDAKLLTFLSDLGKGIIEYLDEAVVYPLHNRLRLLELCKEGYLTGVDISIRSTTSRARLIGYNDSSIYIPVLRRKLLEVHGEVYIPASYEGEILHIYAAYNRLGRRYEKATSLYMVKPARTKAEYMSGINASIYATYLYYLYLEDAKQFLLNDEFSKALQLLRRAAKFARLAARYDLEHNIREILGRHNDRHVSGGVIALLLTDLLKLLRPI